MELRHLRYFVAVAESENVSKAALQLHVSQPAVSRQVRDLEQELGFQLFVRSAKSLHLTEAGRIFLQESQAVLQRAEEAVKAGQAVAAASLGELHIGYAPSPTARMLPPTLRAFQERLPRVRVRLHDLSTEEMLAGVQEGKLQMALIVRPNRASLRGLHFEELARDSMCVAMAPDHAFARLRSVTPAQLATEPLITLTRKDYPEYHEYLASLFAGTNAKPKIAEEHDSASSLIAAVESGCGVAIMGQSLICSVGQRLKLVPLSPAPEPLVLGAIWLKKGLTEPARRFLESAQEAIAKNATGSS
jgi:DNA-binding transcriptional LysR family regulator